MSSANVFPDTPAPSQYGSKRSHVSRHMRAPFVKPSTADPRQRTPQPQLPFLWPSFTASSPSLARAYSTHRPKKRQRKADTEPATTRTRPVRPRSKREMPIFGATPKSAAEKLMVSEPPVQKTSVPSRQAEALNAAEADEPMGLEDKVITGEDLHKDLAAQGVQVIDKELTIDFDADVPGLQNQLHHINRLFREFYPRTNLADNLPYQVWKSENESVLKLWLKIMAKKWETRFEAVPDVHPDDEATAVLDEMVTLHGMSNEAAERMAKRFAAVAEKRANMVAEQADGSGLDKDEFDAGMGWLRNEDAGHSAGRDAQQKRQLHSTPMQSALPVAWRRALSFEQSTRSYSTRSGAGKSSSSGTASGEQSRPDLPTELPHLTSSGSAHMVSVSAKAHTTRTAVALGRIHFSNPTPLTLIRSNSLKKGDVLSVARIAGIMAAKNCPQLIPLCHPIALSHVGVALRLFDEDNGGVEVQATVQCTGPTGVEMEALTSVMGAALTVVDMCKAVDKGMRVEGVRVVLKEGGRSGTWREEGWEEFEE